MIIETEADIKKGVKALCKACPHMRNVYDVTGQPPLRRTKAGFPGLVRIIVGQQLSIASANAIWGRVEKIIRPMTHTKLLKLDDEKLRAAGLSNAKCRTLRALGEAIKSGSLDLSTMDQVEDEAVHERLTNIHGIGPWTADIYLMFCLGRADSWAPGDLALKHAVRTAIGLDEMPSGVEMVTHAERWRPWRGVAARLLWANYAALKKSQTPDPL